MQTHILNKAMLSVAVFFTLSLCGYVLAEPESTSQAKPICEDGRLEMDCKGGSTCQASGSSWTVAIKAKVKQVLDVGANADRRKMVEIDKGLERLKEIENNACIWWNACMDMETWANLRKQTFETMMYGLSISKQRGSTDTEIDNLQGALKDLEDFYQNGIDQKFRVTHDGSH